MEVLDHNFEEGVVKKETLNKSDDQDLMRITNYAGYVMNRYYRRGSLNTGYHTYDEQNEEWRRNEKFSD